MAITTKIKKEKETVFQVKAESSAKLKCAIKLLEEKVMREFQLTNLVDKILVIKNGEISIK